MRSARVLCVLAVTATLMLAGNVFAGTVFSDNFNNENGKVGVLNYTGFAQWTVTAGAVDLIGMQGNGVGYFDLQPGNGLYVDLDGSKNAAGTMVSKAIVLDPGKYVLSYDLAGNHRGAPLDEVTATVNLSIGGSPLSGQTIKLASQDPFQTYSQTFTVTSPTTVFLNFAAVGKDNQGMLLDNVAVTAIPVPAAAWGGLVLLGGVGAARIRRRLA